MVLESSERSQHLVLRWLRSDDSIHRELRLLQWTSVGSHWPRYGRLPRSRPLWHLRSDGSINSIVRAKFPNQRLPSASDLLPSNYDDGPKHGGPSSNNGSMYFVRISNAARPNNGSASVLPFVLVASSCPADSPNHSNVHVTQWRSSIAVFNASDLTIGKRLPRVCVLPTARVSRIDCSQWQLPCNSLLRKLRRLYW